MGSVVYLRPHARTPTEASRAKLSASKLRMRATPVPRRRDQCSAGIESLNHHLRTADKLTPMSEAIASLDGHQPMIERNETGSVIDSVLGHLVLNGKPNVSHDCAQGIGQHCPMPHRDGKSAFKQEFIARVKRAREEAHYTQEQMARLLQIDQGTYKQYESRSLLPHALVERFALACRIEIGWLFSGVEQATAHKRTVNETTRPKGRHKRSTNYS